MNEDLGELLRGIRTQFGGEIASLQEDWRELLGNIDYDEYKAAIEDSMRGGIYVAHSETGLRLLKERYGNNEKIGKVLRVTANAITRMFGRRRLSGPHIATVDHFFGRRFHREKDELAILGAWIEAAACIRAKKRELQTGQGTSETERKEMTYEEGVCLANAILSTEWQEARRSRNAFDLDKTSKKIMKRSRSQRLILSYYTMRQEPWKITSAPDLERLVKEWREAFLLAAGELPTEEEPR